MPQRKIVLCALIALWASTPAHSQEIGDAEQSTAESMHSSVQTQMGTVDGIKTFAINPLSSETQMSTFDGSKQFEARLSCQASHTFFDMLTQPQSNGNLKIISMRQDTSLDGNINTYTTPNWEMSAVCSNGFMMCQDPNNAATCSSYTWQTEESSYSLGITEGPMSQLGGCYCINQNCGSNLVWNNIETILDSLAGGISAALSTAHPFFKVVDTSVSGTGFTLKGSDDLACNPAKADSVLGTEDGQALVNSNYTTNSAQLLSDGFSATESSSLYQKLSQSTYASDNHQTHECSIKRTIGEDRTTLEDIISFDSGSGGLYQVGDNTLRIILGRIGDNYWSGWCDYKTQDTRFYVQQPERIISATLKNARFDDWIQVHVDNQYIWSGPYNNWTDPNGNVPGACELKTSWNQSPNIDFTSNLKKKGPVHFVTRVEVAGNGEGYILGDIIADTSCKLVNESILDNCTPYQQSNDCELLEETVDEVKTFTNGFSTGLIPLPKTMGPICDTGVTRDWWEKKRVYRCNSNVDTDYAKAFQRAEYIAENATNSQFKDMRFNEDGTQSFSSGNLSLYDSNVETCPQVCKTRKAVTAADMSLAGVTNDKTTSDTQYDIFYHECGSSSTCPAGTGEEVIKACQCLNEFSEAASIMQILRMAGQDRICSNGTKATP